MWGKGSNAIKFARYMHVYVQHGYRLHYLLRKSVKCSHRFLKFKTSAVRCPRWSSKILIRSSRMTKIVHQNCHMILLIIVHGTGPSG